MALDTTIDKNASWDDLLKKARKLESAIDAKLAKFEGDIENELEQLLDELNRTISSMQSLIHAAGSDIVSHPLARHLNIYQELSQEFRQKRSAVRTERQRTELMSSFSSSLRATRDIESGELYIQDQSRRAVGQIDTVINQAQATFSALTAQRGFLGNIGSKANNIGSILPSVGHLLTAIRRRKNRDTLILSAVISVCTVLLFLYWISK